MDLDFIKSLVTGEEDELDDPRDDAPGGEASALAKATWRASATRNPVSWVRHVLSESDEFAFRPQGDRRWVAVERHKGRLVSTTVAIEGDMVVAESVASIGINEENVDAVRAYQMLRQGVFMILGYERAEPGRPLAACCRHVITADLDLDRLITATNHNVCAALSGALDIVGGADVADVWCRDRARTLRAIRKIDRLFGSDD